VELLAYSDLHITSPIVESGGELSGIMIRTERADSQCATIDVSVGVQNASLEVERRCVLQFEIIERASGEIVGSSISEAYSLSPAQSAGVSAQIEVENPKLWSVRTPHLYHVRVKILGDEGELVDSCIERFGIRRIQFTRKEGFILNGVPMRLRGVNRHQEYPYVGYAVPANSQYREAIRIKEAGFDYVRLSHYPQSTSFLDACDELGIVVMNCIPGWQHQGGHEFERACFDNARLMIRRDRNHPSICLWELSLNETDMTDVFMETMYAIGHEELPGDQMFTCGWMDRFDVYMQSRQHGNLNDWSNGEKACVIAENGDWEFYASNEGFSQSDGDGLIDSELNSRKFRGDGDKGMLQQVDNFMIAHNDNRNTPAAMDGLWAMFDYARGYHKLRAAVGVMDIFRLPKFSYYFFRSQRDSIEKGHRWSGGPMVFVASQLEKNLQDQILVFSNCQEVELRLDDKVFARQRPTVNDRTQYLANPPFYFDLGGRETKLIEATGFIAGEAVAIHKVERAGEPCSIEIIADDKGLGLSENGDLIFVHVQMLDAKGNLCYGTNGSVKFSTVGNCWLASGTPFAEIENGIASTLLRVGPSVQSMEIRADYEGLDSKTIKLSSDCPPPELAP
jgi:beta-galactosidase